MTTLSIVLTADQESQLTAQGWTAPVAVPAPAPTPAPAPAPASSASVPAFGSAMHSRQFRSGPADWIDTSALPASVPWSVYADANNALAPSQKGVWASAWKKLHLWGNPPGLYQRMPRMLDGAFAQSNPQAGTDDPVAIVGKIPAFAPQAGARGSNIVSPYTTWHGHTRIKPDGTLGSARAPLYVGIRLDGMMQFAYRDGSIVDAAHVPGVSVAYDFSMNPPNRLLFYVADWTNGKIVQVDRSKAGVPEDPALYVYTDFVTGLTKPTSVRITQDGTMYVAANGEILKVVNGGAVPLLAVPGVFWLDYTSTGKLVAMTTNTQLYVIDPAAPALGVDLLASQNFAVPFVQCSVDRNGTFGPVDDIYAVRDHGVANTDLWRISGSAVYDYGHIIPSGLGLCTVGDTQNCQDVFGHYMWVVECHPDEALLLTQGFADCYPTLIRPALASDAPEDVYDHALMVRGAQIIQAGTTFAKPFGSQPTFTCLTSERGWSMLGCTADFVAQMSYADAAAFVQKGMIGSFPRPEIVGYDLLAVLYLLYRSSQRFLKEGKPLMDGLRAFVGPVTATAAPSLPIVYDTDTFVQVIPDPAGLKVEFLGSDWPKAITDASLVLRVLVDEGTAGQQDLGTVQAPWTLPKPALTGLHAYTTHVVSGATGRYWSQANVI